MALQNNFVKLSNCALAQVEIQFFLNHWSEIRGSDGMRHVWQQIRVGRHPGFEEGTFTVFDTSFDSRSPYESCFVVWPLIAVNLEFKPPAAEETVQETPVVAS